ncbi:MAG: ABC transporter ATP-binding protein [Arthrobacter sp.]|nr:ABC transporter ATP-binding protein [Arthrobacter sp.]
MMIQTSESAAAVDVPLLSVRVLSKSFGTKDARRTVLAGINLDLAQGEFVTIIGPSGCGKSTLLSCLAGLVDVDEGTITSGGEPVHGPGRDRVVVFQQASLLPWRTVRRNIAYGAELAGWDKNDIKSRVEDGIRLVGLSGHEEDYPSQISGGMQQRTNLARALVMDAPIILMDEPFGALDAITRRNLQDELTSLHRTLGRTVVFITHDIEEAVYLADRVVVMGVHPGRIIHEEHIAFPRPRHRDLTNTIDFRRTVARLDALLHPGEQTNRPSQAGIPAGSQK